MTNRARGLLTITIQGEEINLLPTFQAMMEFEEMAGISTFEAMLQLKEQRAQAKVIVAAIWAGQRGFEADRGRMDLRADFNSLGEKCHREGIATIAGHAFKFLTFALSSDADLEAAQEKLGNAESGD